MAAHDISMPLGQLEQRMNISYLFPVELYNLIYILCEEIEKFIYLAKIGENIDKQTEDNVVNQISTADKEIDRQIRERLRSLHSELSMLTFSRRHNKH